MPQTRPCRRPGKVSPGTLAPGVAWATYSDGLWRPGPAFSPVHLQNQLPLPSCPSLSGLGSWGTWKTSLQGARQGRGRRITQSLCPHPRPSTVSASSFSGPGAPRLLDSAPCSHPGPLSREHTSSPHLSTAGGLVRGSSCHQQGSCPALLFPPLISKTVVAQKEVAFSRTKTRTPVLGGHSTHIEASSEVSPQLPFPRKIPNFPSECGRGPAHHPPAFHCRALQHRCLMKRGVSKSCQKGGPLLWGRRLRGSPSPGRQHPVCVSLSARWEGALGEKFLQFGPTARSELNVEPRFRAQPESRAGSGAPMRREQMEGSQRFVGGLWADRGICPRGPGPGRPGSRARSGCSERGAGRRWTKRCPPGPAARGARVTQLHSLGGPGGLQATVCLLHSGLERKGLFHLPSSGISRTN